MHTTTQRARRLLRVDHLPAASSSTYTANALNQYTGAAGVGMSYDVNGNLKGDGTWTYGYDLDNRMKTASRSGTSASLAYDPEGRLVKTTVNAVDTNLMYDGQKMVGEYDSTGKLVRRYVFGPGVDEPLVQYEGAVTTSKSWLYANQQGSVVALANVSGATTSSQSYGPFGETTGTPASRFGYTGQQYLAPLGLYYYKARMYSPNLGRFLQTDPVGYADDLNWYAYVGNNPANFTDPSGLAGLSGTAFAYTPNGFGSGTQVAMGPLLPFLAIGLVANEIANSDVPMIGGSLAKAGVNAAEGVAKNINLSLSKYGEAAQHVSDAIKAGQPEVLTINRAGAAANRQASIGGLAKVPGKQLDEYPPAMFKEGGAGASVRPISPGANMGAGACIGNACRGLPDGARVRITVGD